MTDCKNEENYSKPVQHKEQPWVVICHNLKKNIMTKTQRIKGFIGNKQNVDLISALVINADFLRWHILKTALSKDA